MAKKSAAKKKTAARTPAPKRAVKAAARSKKAPVKKAPARKAAPAARKPAGKTAKKAARTVVRKVVKKAVPARKAATKKAVRKAAPKVLKAAARKPAARQAPARKVAPKAPVRKAVKAAAKAPAVRKTAPKVVAPVRKPAPKAAVAKAPARHVPALDRERRTVSEPTPTAPSSLVSNRHASAASSGADELRVRLANHTGTGPAITAGDVDANWEAAETVGDEAPGGDNPTPDQDVVDEIGKALGVEYDDDEELQGGDEIAARDHDRWELDPASSDDFDER